ncbi:RNA polymerase sigma factor [Muriicola sp. Z0-33]|uniref:RNA polymerase sigma factor n=1 Tax=Muriicola sp. Z0-33 TaxID=2816957 RepID=UPI0022383A9C|nr:sigma-70 family RNA polymerase sigma factor [Muriicola sp. Z0-33]MCW5516890.1 sigma-70 family RNA polymerase sigma factor [Muriicola sp. Z0-33]
MAKEFDQILFRSLKEGSDIAFKKVYQDNRSLFLNFARKYGIPAADVLDIYQDAYIVFYENIGNGKLTELRSSISTYLMSIGKYMIMDRIRKDKKKIRSEELIASVGEIDSEIASYEIGNEELSTKQLLLRTYFDQLGEKCKAILTLFYYKKYSIKEIMIHGNYNSENVVKSQKSRCLRTLKELFKSTAR